MNGGAECWGDNTIGELGSDSTTQGLVPVRISGLTSAVTAIAAGAEHACAVVNGATQCWGNNAYGELGNNSSTNESNVPVPVIGLTSGVTTIAAGAYFTCAIVNGSAQCWGAGVLGNNSTTSSNVPVSVTGLTTGASAITVGAGPSDLAPAPASRW